MTPSLAKINSNDVSWSPKRLKLKGFKPFLLSVTMTFHILRSIYMRKTHAKPLKIKHLKSSKNNKAYNTYSNSSGYNYIFSPVGIDIRGHTLKIRAALAFYESPLLDTSMSHLWQN